MIFVTVGTTPYDFSRLIKEMDKIAVNIEEDVIMQIGESNIYLKMQNFLGSLQVKIYKSITRMQEL